MAIEAVVENVAEEVASNLEEVAQVTRSINASSTAYFLLGAGIGTGIGLYLGYKFSKEKIRAQAYKDAEEEVAKLREVYQQKMMVAAEKPAIEELIEEKGYVIGVPNAMGNPITYSQGFAPTPESLGYSAPVPARERPLRPPVPVAEPSPSASRAWNYRTELETRSPDRPYVIHQDEYNNSQQDYSKVVYTYFSGDDVLLDTEDNHPVPHGDMIVGQDNLKWGHGSDDIDAVYVRNDGMRMDIQICRTPHSYEEEVLGLTDDDDN